MPTIRLAQPADLDLLLYFEEVCFPNNYHVISRKHMDRFLSERSSAKIWIHEDEDEQGPFANGYALITYKPHVKNARVYSIAVHPRFAGQGIGKRLLQTVIQDCRESGFHTLHSEVELTNEASLSLFKSCGFLRYMRLEWYYGKGKDGVRMRLVLSQKKIKAAGDAAASRRIGLAKLYSTTA